MRIDKQFRDVYVVIYDSKKFVKVLDILKYFDVKFRGIDTTTKHIHGVIILDLKGYEYLVDNDVDIDGYIINVDVYGLEKGVATAIIYAKSFVVNPLKKIVIGIDYGKNIGMAVVVNDTVIYTRSYRSADHAVKDIKFFIDNVDSEHKVVRIGIAQDIDEVFINTVVEMFKDVADIEFVPEYRSSKHRYLLDEVRLSPDEIAAINIAFYRTHSNN